MLGTPPGPDEAKIVPRESENALGTTFSHSGEPTRAELRGADGGVLTPGEAGGSGCGPIVRADICYGWESTGSDATKMRSLSCKPFEKSGEIVLQMQASQLVSSARAVIGTLRAALRACVGLDDPAVEREDEWACAIRAPEEDNMGVDDIVNKGKQMFEQNRDKIEEALKSEKAEDVSDKLLAGAADAIKKVVPEEHHAKIDETRDNVDKHIGNQ